jgi:hypothetical protein
MDVFEKSLDIFRGVFAKGYSLFLRRIYCSVVDISQVHYLYDCEASVFEPSSENVLKNEGSEVADMRIIIHRWPTRVHFDFFVFKWFESFFLARERVE